MRSCSDVRRRHRTSLHTASQADQNAFIKRFNRSYRKEVLNAQLFDTIVKVQQLNHEIRPHDAPLGTAVAFT